jgi:peptidoglycan/LPS O-acetylase OafA/YrhL
MGRLVTQFIEFIRFRQSRTFGSILGERKGEGPGFAILRVGLAVGIFLMHSRMLSTAGNVVPIVGPAVDGHAAWSGPMRPVYVVLVPAFFALSGFLVTGSALRLRNTGTFLTFRVLRILPALFVEVTLCAIVLGSAFTTLPLRSYFTHYGFWRYFGNIVGIITFYLPGVFLQNRMSIVNANLWTLPSEFDCYFITAILMATGLFYKTKTVTGVVVVVSIVFAVLNAANGFAVTPFQYTPLTVTYYFFIGMAFFYWKSRIPARWSLFIAAVALSYAFLYSQRTIFIAPIFVVYCVVFLGVVALPEIGALKTRDYSYGIYLYGFPITQGLVAAFPGLVGHKVIVSLAALTLTTLFAATSWKYVEKPTLALKKSVPAWADAALRRSGFRSAEISAQASDG